MLQKLCRSKILLNLMKISYKVIKSYSEECDEGYFLEVDVQYPERLHELHSDLPFLSEGMKIEKSRKAYY